MNKMGRIGKLNQRESRQLKRLWLAKDINWCEYPEPHDCSFGMIPTNAHRHKKREYIGKPDELRWHINQVIRLCGTMHNEIEYDAEATEQLFLLLRRRDIINDIDLFEETSVW